MLLEGVRIFSNTLLIVFMICYLEKKGLATLESESDEREYVSAKFREIVRPTKNSHICGASLLSM